MKSVRLTLALALGATALPLVLAAAPVGASTPTCVVSLSPTATSTLYAIGAGGEVQAVDTDSLYPTTGLPTTRINALNPNVESIAGVCHGGAKPNLVVIAYNPNDLATKLRNLGITVVEQDAATSLNGAYQQIQQLGTLTGHASAANALVASMKQSIAASLASVPAHPTKKISVYYEVSTNPYYSLTSQTFVGSILKRLGLANIADAAATSADAGYPSLNAEYIVKANPDLIVLAGDASPASVAKRAGWSSVTAVRQHDVIALDAGVASQWGPRLTILVRDLANEVRHVLTQK